MVTSRPRRLSLGPIGPERLSACAFRHPGAGGPPPPRRTIPARETWYAEPAKVADNFYFLGTKIHSAWAIVGSQGVVIIEALFDYAAKDEILGGLKTLGLDSNKVKYVILFGMLTAITTGCAKLCRLRIPGYTSSTVREVGSDR